MDRLDSWNKVLKWQKRLEEIYSMPLHEAIKFPEPKIDPELELWVSPEVDSTKRKVAQLIRKVASGVITQDVIDLCSIIEKLANSDISMTP